MHKSKMHASKFQLAIKNILRGLSKVQVCLDDIISCSVCEKKILVSF